MHNCSGIWILLNIFYYRDLKCNHLFESSYMKTMGTMSRIVYILYMVHKSFSFFEVYLKTTPELRLRRYFSILVNKYFQTKTIMSVLPKRNS